MDTHQTIKLGNTEYVILPKAEYLRLRHDAGVPIGSVDASDYARASIGATLRAARHAAKLSQAELGARLGKSQPLISGAESGAISVSARYVSAVLKACGLPRDWRGDAIERPTGRGRKR
jgi:hypothetical protein